MPSPKILKCLALTLAAVSLAALLNAQQAPTPPAGGQMVSIPVTVHDKHGKTISGLSQNDFQVDEDGRPQTIRSFSLDNDQPLTFGLLIESRLARDKNFGQQRSATEKFVDEILREGKDKAFLIHFDREVELLQDFTSSRQKLDTAINSLQAPAESSGGRERDSNSRRGGQGARRGGGVALNDAVYLAANEMLQKQPGRKAIIILTQGLDRGSKMRDAQAIEAAQRANIVVYSILLPRQQEQRQQSPYDTDGPVGRPGGYPPGYPGGYPRYPGGPRPYPQPRPQPPQERGDPKQLLQPLSKDTGGRLFELSKKQTIEQTYQEIQEDLRNQYNLGYTSDRPGDGSDYHRIQVSTKQKDVAVQARNGYYVTQSPDAKSDAKKDKQN